VVIRGNPNRAGTLALNQVGRESHTLATDRGRRFLDSPSLPGGPTLSFGLDQLGNRAGN